MKKSFFLIALIVALVAGPAFGASSMVVQTPQLSKNGNVLTVPILCTAHTDGTFDDKTLAAAEVQATIDALSGGYETLGFILVEVRTKNAASPYPTGGVVTVSTATTGKSLATVTLSTSASGAANGTFTSAFSAERTISELLKISCTDTGTAANVFTLYLVFIRW